MIDPRASIISKRTEDIGRVIAFASGKGGVGKSACAAVTALKLAAEGKRVGLLDLDFTGASAHLFLGAELRFPEEERGVLPATLDHGLRFMSAAVYSGERGLALRGGEASDVFLELFAITRWENLDFLLLDMPPGLGDELLDLLRYIRALEAVLITTPSRVSTRVVGRMATLFREQEVSMCGMIRNMSAGSSEFEQQLRDVKLLAEVPLCPDLEQAIGSPRALLDSSFAAALQPAAARLMNGGQAAR